jgi:uncharacterized protein YecT (DUF1311 family)
MRLSFIFVAIAACAVSCRISVLAADEEPEATQVPSEESLADSNAKDSSQESSPSLPVVDLGNRKAEIVAGTGSPDGRLALAWTLRPSKDVEPVDWDLLGKDRDKFRDTYGDDERYFVEILVVDHKNNKSLATLKLAGSWSLPGYEHESLAARWGPEDKDGRRFVIVNCDRKWSPQDLILLSVAGDSISQRSLLRSLDQSVQKFVAQKNKRRRAPPAKDYTVEYPIFGLPEIGERKGFSDPITLWLPFEALIPKSEEAPGYSGVLHLKLAQTPEGPTVALEGAPIANSEKDVSEDLMSVSGDARLLEADRRLNEVYGALRGHLSPAARDQLKHEQLFWINDRNAAWDVTKGEAEEKSLETPFAAANREAVKMTQERTAQLKQWSDKLKSNPKYNPIEAETWIDRADAHAKAKQYDAAVKDLQKAIEVDANNGEYYMEVGWYQLFNRKPHESITASQKALELAPDDAVVINTNLAHAYLFDNQLEKAKAIYLENKDAKVDDKRTFSQAVLDDFKELQEAGITHPDMEKIKALLSSKTEAR